MKPSALPLVFASLLLAAAPAFTQTDGIVGTSTGGNWTTLPWFITSGPDAYPTGGGTATITSPTATTPGTVPATTTTLTLDSPVTLAGIDFNTKFFVNIAGTAPNTLALAATGGTIRLLTPILSGPTTAAFTGTLSAPISGGGSQGLTVTGSGILNVTGTANTYTGGTHVGGGATIRVGGGDGSLGTVGAGNDIFLDDGTLYSNGASLATSRNITLGTGGGTLMTGTAMSVSGVISGGGLTLRSYTAVALTLNAANSYTGATVSSNFAPGTNTSTPKLTLAGAGSIASSSSYDFTGTVNLDNSATNVNGRLSATAPIAVRGAEISLTGNAGAATQESFGALTLKSGASVLTIKPDAAQSTSLSFASITREGAATLYLSGTNLGATPGPGVATITSALAPTLVGGGGAAGSTTISILPWAFGNVSTTTYNGGSFVTYDATTGFRPLATSEYRLNSTGSPTDNVRITLTNGNITTAATVNSLLFAPGATATLSGMPLTITSGAFLYSPTAAVSTSTVSASLNFGSAEGIISNTSALTLSGAISGTGGLTLNPFGVILTLGGTSTYTGTTTIVGGGGNVRFSGTVAADGVTPGPFGLDTSAIVIRPETGAIALQATAAGTVLNRDLTVQNTGIGLVTLGTVSAGNNLTVNGAISLAHPLTLATAANTAASGITLNGLISGPGMLNDNSASYVTLNHPNTFSGGANIKAGTWNLGADDALGTGTIWISGAGVIQSTSGTARTLSNGLQFVSSNVPSFRGAGSLTFTGPLDLNGSQTINVIMTDPAKTTFTGEVKNGSLTKTGSGGLNLARPAGNTYSGGTVLGANAGTLEVNNTSGSGTGTGAVSIGTGSTLAGSFTISGSTLVSGTLSPGPAEGGIGAAKFGNDLSLGSAAVTRIGIAGATSFDTIQVAGTVSLDGTIAIALVGGYVPDYGSVFQFFGWGNLLASGFDPATDFDFSGAPLAPGQYWDTTNFLANGSIAAIPEPQEYAIALAALLGGLIFRRRRA